MTAKNPEAAAAKLVAAAYAELSQGRSRAAIDLATAALRQNAAIRSAFSPAVRSLKLATRTGRGR